MTLVFLNKDKNAANKINSATARVQEHPEVPLLAEVRDVAGNAQEVSSVVLEGDAANSGTPVKYCLVLSAGSVCESDGVLLAPLELIAEQVHAVLDVEQLLYKEPVSLEQRVEPAEDGVEAALEDDDALGTRKVDEVRNCAASRSGGRNALDEWAWGEQVADAGGELSSWRRGWRLFDARKESAAGGGVWRVEDGAARVDVEVVVVLEVVVQVVWNVVAGGIVRALLAAASLSALVLTVSLLSK
jgi:hypothetical protein